MLVMLPRFRLPYGVCMASLAEEPEYRQSLSRAAVEAVEDMVILAAADAFLGSASSHFSMMVSLLRYANGHPWRPTFLDEVGVANGDFSVGLMHLGNMRRPADPTDIVDTSVRWKLMASRFSRETYLPPEVPFEWDATSALPKIGTAFFDSEVAQWQPPPRLGERSCSPSREPVARPEWDDMVHSFLELHHYDSAWCALRTWQQACSAYGACSEDEWDRIAFFFSVLQSLAKKEVWAGAARKVERSSGMHAYSTTHAIRTHRLTLGCLVPIRGDGATLVASIRSSLQRAAYDEAEACAWRILFHSPLELRPEIFQSARSLTDAIGGRAGLRARLGRWSVVPAPLREPDGLSDADDVVEILELGSSALLLAYAVSLQWCSQFVNKGMRLFADQSPVRTRESPVVAWHCHVFRLVPPLDQVRSTAEDFEAETWVLFQLLVRRLKTARFSPLLHDGENRLYVRSVRLSRLQLQDSGQGRASLTFISHDSSPSELCALLFLNSAPHGLIVESDEGTMDERSLAGQMLLLPCGLAATGTVRLRGDLPLWLLVVVLSHQAPMTEFGLSSNPLSS